MLRARNYATKKCLKTLYYSYIYPYLIYCIEIWGISPQTFYTFASTPKEDRKNYDLFFFLYTHSSNIQGTSDFDFR